MSAVAAQPTRLPDGPKPDPAYRFEIHPICIGPTWKRDENGQFIQPQHTGGWQVLKWITDNLIAPSGDGPFRPTPEQQRFILWWYAVDEYGEFLYREGVLQRLKGWGKDPLAAVICAVEFVGPCRFAGWARRDMPELGVRRGEPVFGESAVAWVQVAAVTKMQTVTTMSLLPTLFSKDCIAEHSITFGKEILYAHGGGRRLQAVSTNWRALEGHRPTFALKGEPHHWNDSNQGHEMADVIDRNVAKAPGGTGRSLSISNAYNPAEGSVMQRRRESYMLQVEGLAVDTQILYDSLEAPDDIRLEPPTRERPWLWERLGLPVPTDNATFQRERDELMAEYLSAIIVAIRGDSYWLPPESIVPQVLDRKHSPSKSLRFWFNRIVAPEDSWLDPQAIRLAVDQRAQEAIRASADYDAGWLVDPNEPVVMFFDGGKSDDSTALMGSCVNREFDFVVGVWQRPPKARSDKSWTAPRGEVMERGLEAAERMNVVAFWGDPSHAKDDEDDVAYWDGVLDAWHRKLHLGLNPWAVKQGDRAHSILWDMSNPDHQNSFVQAAMTVVAEFEHLNDVEEFDPIIRIDGHPALMDHLRNAKKNPNSRYGVSLMKEGRESARKIDLAVALVGARMLRRVVLNAKQELEEPMKAGRLWG